MIEIKVGKEEVEAAIKDYVWNKLSLSHTSFECHEIRNEGYESFHDVILFIKEKKK